MSVGDRVRSSLLHARTGEITRVEPEGLVYVRWDGEPQVKGKLTHAYYLLLDEPTDAVQCPHGLADRLACKQCVDKLTHREPVAA